MKPIPAPSRDALHEAALAYLSHRSASTAQMKQVLGRRIDAWARRVARSGTDDASIASSVETSRAAAATVVERLKESGLLDDEAFAQRRAASLSRAGKSRRAIAFDLSQKGIPDATARDAIPADAETELAAAVTLARKKRLGPFARTDDVDAKERQRWLGALARAGYSFSVAERALRMDRESAEELLRRDRPIGW